MKVDKHISELLYEHDCVVVPDLGGFVANYAPAKIHPTQHTFTPPSKKIVFNKNLKNNDGLLANHIASSEKTTYPEALKYIHVFTSNTNSLLRKGEKVMIDELGTLFLDVERNIQFEPATTNYLLDAFGLSQFQSPAIKLDNIDRGQIPAEKRKIRIKRYVALAIALPLIFGMIWIPLKTDLLKNTNYSNLNPFASKETAKYCAIETAKSNLVKVKVAEPTPLLVANDTVKTSLLNLADNTAKPVTESISENKITGIVKADSTSVSTASVNTNLDFDFHIIAGCFQIEDNATKFVADLQNQNITASILEKRNGLYVVSVGDYNSRNEAYTQLKQLRKSQPDAWLLKNN
jgi:hypothetical protein